MKRARRMFKQIDCDNLVQTTQRMVAEAFASPRAMDFGHRGGEDPNSRYRMAGGRDSNDFWLIFNHNLLYNMETSIFSTYNKMQSLAIIYIFEIWEEFCLFVVC